MTFQLNAQVIGEDILTEAAELASVFDSATSRPLCGTWPPSTQGRTARLP